MSDTVLPPLSVISLSTSAKKQLENDVLRIQFSASHSAKDAADVQLELQKILSEALKAVRPLKQEEAIEVETNGFHIGPLYSGGKNNHISGYAGQVSLTVYGTDREAIARLVPIIRECGMSINGMQNSLSRSSHKAAERELMKEAIRSFQEKAAFTAEMFGSEKWSLGAINLSTSADNGSRGYMIAASAAPTADFDVEGGKTTASASVIGEIVLDGEYGPLMRGV